MANIVYNKFKEQLFQGNVSLLSDTLKVALINSLYNPDADHNTYSVSLEPYEITASGGYTSGGKELTGKTITEVNIDNNVIFDADDVEWENSTISARYGVIYDATVSGVTISGGTDNLVALIDFGSQKISTSGNFIIDWDDDGIFSLT